ncbi:LegC family aminotransferase [Muricauda sp. JGD-17]|uniref:GDP-perosamine synthase n=1 Tax=Flagellimonas ochracea TaxID=2696472 RepID=A0A964TB74_9FLAO|nr:LegC family aminotransferase [Allomuricauda ochracea]NAY91648.1 LegC family aminotransferase [Allomuricauda ochracea]
MAKFKNIIEFIRTLYGGQEFVPLHEPRFLGNEKKYVQECIDSTFVSSVGAFVDGFERQVAEFTGSKYAVATVNGTAALHVALLLVGVERDDEVITQPLTFIATCNAISYIGAHPVFVDVDKETLGLSPQKLKQFLSQNTEVVNGQCINKTTKRKIKAVVPMHTFGFPAKIDELMSVCSEYNLSVVEDAAESLGSYYKRKHTGTFGLLGAFSFNGNKIITTGGGGMIVTDDEALAKKAKHMTTTAKIPHAWEYDHDMSGYNYRLPNLNAALGSAQMELLPEYLSKKNKLARDYQNYFEDSEIDFFEFGEEGRPNHWLNAVVLDSLEERNKFLEETNSQGIMTRPVWKLMNRLEIFKKAQTGNLENAVWLEERIVNIPSSVIMD